MKAWTLGLLTLPFSAQGQNCEQFAPPVEIHGKKFFDSYTGEYVPIKGISYYPRPNEGELTVTNSIDFFTEEYRSIWERDIEKFKDLNVNAVRLYAVDPSRNHDGFMCALKAAGIYAIVGLAAECYNCAITTDLPPLCYPPELKSRGEYIIQQFAKYENVLAFSAGNEISLSKEGHSTENAPCQKKFLRDMRAYIAGCSESMRKIPVGIIKADVDREDKALYYNCRSDPADELENADFIGINSYLHCDGSITDLDEMSFETQDGHETQRNFLQVEALYSKRFREQFAGGFVFEYSTEKKLATSPYPFDTFGPNNFGVGYFRPENCDDVNTPCEYVEFPQFDNLAEKYEAVDTSDEANSVFYRRGWQNPAPPACPDNFPPLNTFVWPSDSVESQICPVETPVFCAGVPVDCSVVTLPPVDASSAQKSFLFTAGAAAAGLVSYLVF